MLEDRAIPTYIDAALSDSDREFAREKLMLVAELTRQMDEQRRLTGGQQGLTQDGRNGLLALGSITVSTGIPGYDPETGNFNINMKELTAWWKQGIGFDGGSAVIAGNIVHDAWHAIQNSRGMLPWNKYHGDPRRIEDPVRRENVLQAFNGYIVWSETEAIGVQAEFIARVPNLAKEGRQAIIDGIIHLTSQEIRDRYWNR